MGGLGKPSPYNEDCRDDSMSEDLNNSGFDNKGTGSVAEYYFEFRGVNKAFDEHVVLRNVSFKVKRGDTCVIMGTQRRGKIGFAEAHHGFSESRLRADFDRWRGRYALYGAAV